MKRRIALALASLLALSAWAQVAHDPNDQIYDDLDLWAARGYVSALPPLRPYPLQLLDELLSSVAAKGDAASAAKARDYLSSISPNARAYHLSVTGAIRGEDSDTTLEGAPAVDGTIRPEAWLSVGYRIAAYGATRSPGSEIDVPGVYAPYADLVEDDAKVGPFYVLQNWTSSVALGNADLYFQSGINRTSFGPFFDNGVVIGPQAGKSGNFNFSYRSKAWSYSQSYHLLNATDDFGDASDQTYPGKQLAIHSLDFYPAENFEFGYFETVIWGDRYEPLYLVPLTSFMGSQALAGFYDNVFMGLHFSWKPVVGLQALGQIYIDDFSFKDTIRLNFDTKYKFASELGLRWVPKAGIFSDFALDYTVVMPYMYSHANNERSARYTEGIVNYQVYSHQGRCLGADLAPNSDRFSLRASFNVIPNLALSLSAGLQRHGNASEDEDNTYDDLDGVQDIDDGSINDDGYSHDEDGGPVSTFNKETRFLTQDVIEMKASAGIGVAFTLPTPIGKFKAGVDYVYEYAWNRNLVEDKDGAAHYYVFSGTWRW